VPLAKFADPHLGRYLTSGPVELSSALDQFI
jgi:hypothetical protein